MRRASASGAAGRTVLVTGANRGIGLEFVRQYLERGWEVVAAARRPEEASALKRLSLLHPGSLRRIALDLLDDRSIAELARFLAERRLDLLISNAAMYGPQQSRLGSVGYDQWLDMFRVNCVGPIRLCEALLPSLERSPEPKVVAISSRMASIGRNRAGGSYLYRSSKAALNAAMRSFAVDARSRAVTVMLLHPGWIDTAIPDPAAMKDPAEARSRLQRARQLLRELGDDRVGVAEAVACMVELIEITKLSSTGRFYGFRGEEIDW